LAVATAKREVVLPDVPTFAEAGVKDFEVSTWYGLFAPRATPVAALDAIHGAVQAALAEPDVKRIWMEQGARIDLESRQAFAEFVKAEVARWSAIARQTSLPME
jgi:tripartite-type tricarboxylate transporter receptor subunit TctC